ncbi:MAG TPA: GTPase Era [Geobacteraceae bacterium]
MSEPTFRSGFVSIVGRPNVGKSTLLNRILGEKLVITSDKPQTTRNRIQGICNLEGGQIVFIDTPGIHRGEKRLNRYMVDAAMSALTGVDVILFLVDATSEPRRETESMTEVLARAEAPVLLVISKIDLIGRDELLTRIAAYRDIHPFREILPISAVKGEGVECLLDMVLAQLPEGPAYFPDDILTDLPERFLAAEIIREKVFRLTRDEIPYAVAVVVESFTERPDGSLIAISAAINVERESQKGIVIGRKGEMLKRIGTQARRDLEELLQTKVFLELFVRVQKEWSENSRLLKEFGYE